MSQEGKNCDKDKNKGLQGNQLFVLEKQGTIFFPNEFSLVWVSICTFPE